MGVLGYKDWNRNENIRGNLQANSIGAKIKEWHLRWSEHVIVSFDIVDH